MMPELFQHMLAQEIIQEVKSEECRCLNHQKLSALLELVIDNTEVMDILRKTPIIGEEKRENIIYFEDVYQTHIVRGKKTFVLMEPIESLALSWLFMLYH